MHTKTPIHRIELFKGPDSQGRYGYFVFWWADYHPGHPDGEHARRERGQVYFGTLDHLTPGTPVDDKRPARDPGTGRAIRRITHV
jgi:hypothetical protein